MHARCGAARSAAKTLLIALLVSQTVSCGLAILSEKHALRLTTRHGHSRTEVTSRRRLDIVLMHYSIERLEPTRKFWTRFLATEKVAALQPHVFLYCHGNSTTVEDKKSTVETWLAPLFKYGGSFIPQENVGREGSGYLHHITRHWDDLADHTLFSQDVPEHHLEGRFQKLFNVSTGFLPLTWLHPVPCNEWYLPAGHIPQMYSMFTGRLCPPGGYTAAIKGEFVVSRRRIRRVKLAIYEYLSEMLTAPEDHWIHQAHNDMDMRQPSDPMFGHIVERAWSLAFQCYETQTFARCDECDRQPACQPDWCQCLDT